MTDSQASYKEDQTDGSIIDAILALYEDTNRNIEFTFSSFKKAMVFKTMMYRAKMKHDAQMLACQFFQSSDVMQLTTQTRSEEEGSVIVTYGMKPKVAEASYSWVSVPKKKD